MPTARELLEQADALMRRNRERALEAERAALRLASEALDDDAPSPAEPATPIVAPGEPVVIAFQPSTIHEIVEPLTTVERMSEHLVPSSERSEADSEAFAKSEESAPEIPELTDIVTIGTPWPLPHASDDAQPVEDAPAVVDEPVDNDTQVIVDELDAREREAPAEREKAPEDALPTDVRDGEAPEASGAVALPAERDSTPMTDAPTEGAPNEESIQTLTTPASVESAETPPRAATLAAEPASSAAPAEKEPWRLWSLFSFGRKPGADEASVPVEPMAVTETDIATLPPASATVAFTELPVESTPSVEAAVPEEKPPVEAVIAEIADTVPEAVTEPSVESAIAGATGIATTDAPDDGVLPLPGTPSIEAAGSSPSMKPGALQDNERWEALAEEIRMQVLQRIDIFTDTHLRDQLGVQLQPIVQRASAELVTTINEQVGKLIRAYIAEAIEREIETWRKNNP